MNISKVFLLMVGTLFIAIGTAYLFAPTELSSLLGITLTSPVAIIEVQGFYGGQLLGLGVFILLGVFKNQYTTAALLLVAAALGFTATGRVFGMITSSEFPVEMLALMAVEYFGAGVALLLLRRA